MAASPEGPKDQGLAPLFDLVLTHVPPARVEDGAVPDARHAPRGEPVPRPHHHRAHRAGAVGPNQTIKVIDRNGRSSRHGRVSKILAFRGIERQPIDEGEAGDIVSIAGLEKGSVADTFCAPEVETPLPAQPIDPPTVAMSFIVNDWPLAGTEGDKVTSRMIRDRLFREARGQRHAARSRNRPTRIRSTSRGAANCSSRS